MRELFDLHKSIISQLTPPPYIYNISYVSDYGVYFSLNQKIDISFIDDTDPIVNILLKKCIRVKVDHCNHSCSFEENLNLENIVLNDISYYILDFIKEHLSCKNPKTSPLYKWIYTFCDYRMQNNDDFMENIIAVYRYLYTNMTKEDNHVHIKNGIALLNMIKAKYENKGFKMEASNGKCRKRY